MSHPHPHDPLLIEDDWDDAARDRAYIADLEGREPSPTVVRPGLVGFLSLPTRGAVPPAAPAGTNDYHTGGRFGLERLFDRRCWAADTIGADACPPHTGASHDPVRYPLEILTCDICQRVGTTGYRTGSKPGKDICTNRRACTKRSLRKP